MPLMSSSDCSCRKRATSSGSHRRSCSVTRTAERPRRRAARASSIGRRLLSLAPRVVWMCMSMMLPLMRSRLYGGSPAPSISLLGCACGSVVREDRRRPAEEHDVADGEEDGEPPRGADEGEEGQEDDEGRDEHDDGEEQVRAAEPPFGSALFAASSSMPKTRPSSVQMRKKKDAIGMESSVSGMPLGTALRMKGMSSRELSTQRANGGVAMMDMAKPADEAGKHLLHTVARAPPRRSIPAALAVVVSISVMPARRRRRSVSGGERRQEEERRAAAGQVGARASFLALLPEHAPPGASLRRGRLRTR